MTKNLLEAWNLTKRFGGLTAVSDFNFTVPEGALHCIIGPNGAGKSTVFKMLMGIYKPTDGSIIFDGVNITKMKAWSRVGLGMSIKMQVPGIFPSLTVGQNLRIAAQKKFKGEALYHKVNSLMDFLSITQLENVQSGVLSHGQQQWLEIGMALASEPRLLLLDEPAAGLGPEETEATAELINGLHDRGLTVLFIEHDMSFVEKLAHSVTVMHLGRKFMEGTMQEVSSSTQVQEIYLGRK